MTHDVPEEFSHRDPRTVVVKQDGTSVTPALPTPDLEKEEEKDDTAGPVELNPCSATYSNLGKYRC
jgi:pseudopodium-enriched atypical kinase 1